MMSCRCGEGDGVRPPLPTDWLGETSNLELIGEKGNTYTLSST